MASIQVLPSGSHRVRHQGRSVGTYPTRADAEAAVAALTGHAHAPRIVALPSTPAAPDTLDAHVEEWLDSLTGRQVDTISRYRRLYLNHISPTLGSLPPASIDSRAVARWQQERLASGMAPKTLVNIRGVLTQALDDAGNRSHARVRPPSRESVREPVYFSREDAHNHLERIRSTRPDWYVLFRTLTFSGMRLGEGRGLQAHDLTDDRVSIRRAMKKDNIVGYPKTARSRRTVTLDAETARLLNAHAAGLAPTDWLFPGIRSGNPVRDSTLHDGVWQPIASKMSPSPRIHDLRHSHCVWLLDAGIPATEVRDRLGHKSIQTTLDIYARYGIRDESAILSVLNEPVHARPILRAV